MFPLCKTSEFLNHFESEKIYTHHTSNIKELLDLPEDEEQWNVLSVSMVVLV